MRFRAVLWALALIGSSRLYGADSNFAQHLQKGADAARRDDLSTAMIELMAARDLDPSSAEVYYRVGLVFGRLGDFRSAETTLRRAVELKPDYAAAHYNLGLSLVGDPQSKLDWPGAIEEFRTALEQSPQYAEAANYLGAGLYSQGDYDGAAAALRTAIGLNPLMAEAHFNLGLTAEMQKRPDEAEREYRVAEQCRSRYPEAATALGKLLLREHKNRAAEVELRTALRANPDLADAHYALARVLRAEQRTAASKMELDEFADIDRRQELAIESSRLTNEGLALAQKGDTAGALQAERGAIALKPDSGVPHHNLGLILADTGAWKPAERELIKAAALLPGRAEPWFDLGRVLARDGNTVGGVEAMEFAECLAPANTRIRDEIESLKAELRRAGKTGKSGSTPMQPLVGPKADAVPEHLAFADQLIAEGDLQGAAGELLHVLVLDPAHIQAREQLVGVYAKQGDRHREELERHKLELLSSATRGDPESVSPRRSGSR